jgi:hypothetical protein
VDLPATISPPPGRPGRPLRTAILWGFAVTALVYYPCSLLLLPWLDGLWLALAVHGASLLLHRFAILFEGGNVLEGTATFAILVVLFILMALGSALRPREAADPVIKLGLLLPNSSRIRAHGQSMKANPLAFRSTRQAFASPCRRA